MREPRGEGGETGKGKLVGESFIHEVGTSVTNMHSFITRIFICILKCTCALTMKCCGVNIVASVQASNRNVVVLIL